MAGVRDPTSFSNFDEIVIEHIDLDLKVDFASKKLSGSALLRLKARKSTRQLVLDSRALAITKVVTDKDVLKYEIKDGGALGEKLIIGIPELQSGDIL